MRHLIEVHGDALDREDYVKLISKLIKDSVRGIEQNLRVRALASLPANLKMIFSTEYSRTHRIGELYEHYLFNRVEDQAELCRPRQMKKLPMHPSGASDFKPRVGNWHRCNKVPNLMLNTTSLNSGHNWHFTARWMGEPPGLAGDEIDMNQRYRRLYYDQAQPEALKNFPLAYAVAASSCVPALFEPMTLSGLYPERTVRLVDGGVHDNQGMAALLDDDCDFLLCSDASGQMASQNQPSSSLFGVFGRTNTILQARVREAQYRDMRNRLDNGALRGLFFIHLKQELEADPVPFVGSEDPTVLINEDNTTTYGVNKKLQRLMANIRTDLDSFTEVEAYSLMASGYLMTCKQLKDLDQEHQKNGLSGSWGGFEVDAPQGDWAFSPLIPLLAQPSAQASPARADLEIQLDKGSVMFGRVWALVRGLRWCGFALAGTAALGLIAWLYNHWETSFSLGNFQVGGAAIALSLALASLAVPALKLLKPTNAVRSKVLVVAAATVGWLGCNIHLKLFEPLLRARGRLSRLLKLG